jgi:hypothetical protein
VLLWMVAAGYAAAQLALGMHRVFLGWDEVLYVSQFSGEMPPGFMDSPRAWGIPFIVAPVAAVAASVETIRIYVISLLSVGVFCVFWAWLRVRDTAAVPLAALLLCCLWVSLFYGNAVMPNMVTALCTVAAVALFLQVSRGLRPGRGARRAMAGLAAAFGVMSLVRPLDTVWIGLPLIAATWVHRPWRRLAAPAAILAGSAGGWIPWIIEAYVRFGGLLPRLEQIARWNGDGLHVQILRHLQSFGSGNLLCTSAESSCGPVVPGAVLVWSALAVLVVVGMLALRGTPHRPAAVITVVVAATNAAAYFFLSQLANPRFLLPTYALLVLPAAEGLRWCAHRLRLAGPVAAASILAAVVGAQLTMAYGVAADMRDARAQEIRRARAVGRLPIHRPCVVYGISAPQIAYLTHCRYWRPYVDGVPRWTPPRKITPVLDRMRARGLHVVIVTRGRRTRDFPAGWTHVRLLPDQSWHAHLPPDQ